jgi:hypothetical protein
VFSSRKALCLLSLLSCALTLGASGDDFSFARLALAPAADVSDPLPEDDPNTDFLASGASGAARRACDSADDGGAAPVRQAAAPVRSIASATPLIARAGGEHFPHVGLNMPLRC